MPFISTIDVETVWRTIWQEEDAKTVYFYSEVHAFYEHLSKLDESFLEENGYSLQEVLDGLKSIAEKTGYGQIIDTLSTER